MVQPKGSQVSLSLTRLSQLSMNNCPTPSFSFRYEILLTVQSQPTCQRDNVKSKGKEVDISIRGNNDDEIDVETEKKATSADLSNLNTRDEMPSLQLLDQENNGESGQNMGIGSHSLVTDDGNSTAVIADFDDETSKIEAADYSRSTNDGIATILSADNSNDEDDDDQEHIIDTLFLDLNGLLEDIVTLRALESIAKQSYYSLDIEMFNS